MYLVQVLSVSYRKWVCNVMIFQFPSLILDYQWNVHYGFYGNETLFMGSRPLGPGASESVPADWDVVFYGTVFSYVWIAKYQPSEIVSCNSVREFFSYVNPKVNELYTAYTITYVALHEVTWSMVVWCTQDLRWDGCSFMWHQPCQCCKYTTSVNIQKTRYKASHSCRTSCECSESAQESGE